MASALRLVFLAVLTFLAIIPDHANGEIRGKVYRKLNQVNKYGPYLGIVVPNQFEMNPLLQHPKFNPSGPSNVTTLDFGGRRFRIGTLAGKNVIVVMTGLSTMNAAITTQLLLSLFRIEGVLHYGIAGNANSKRHLGDVVIPQKWAHTSLWSWQRYGNGPNNELPLEPNGDYTREYGYLEFAKYATNVSSCNGEVGNLLNNVWYQPEEVFPVDGTPEKREQVFWVDVDADYFKIATKIQHVELQRCYVRGLLLICLPNTPRVSLPSTGSSSSFYVDNAAYRQYLRDHFKVTPIDMESAAVSLVCYQQKKPFIAFRALSNLAGSGSADDGSLLTLAVDNSITVLVAFVEKLAANGTKPAPAVSSI